MLKRHLTAGDTGCDNASPHGKGWRLGHAVQVRKSNQHAAKESRRQQGIPMRSKPLRSCAAYPRPIDALHKSHPMRLLQILHLAALCVALQTQTQAQAQAQQLAPLAAGAASAPPPPWHLVGLPNQTKPFTRFDVVTLDGKRVLRIEADASFGNLVHPLGQATQPGHLSWQWRLEKPLDKSDLNSRSGDDTALKVCAFFDEPLDSIPFTDRQVLRLARSRSNDPVPAATICYVWDTRLAEGTVLDSPFTRRLRYVVVDSGNAKLDRWVAHRRDLAADFKRLFGDETTQLPPLVGIAVGADADNTRGKSVGYVADVLLEP